MKHLRHHHYLFAVSLVSAAICVIILVKFLSVAYPSLEQGNQTTTASASATK